MNPAYDLHIHSCLSPCASDDMTPHNIAAMAELKGLGIISLTDHNSGSNLEAMADAAQMHGLIFVPGIEVCSQEEVHVLTYFPDLETAVSFADGIYESLPEISNDPLIFGNQIIMDTSDKQAGRLDKLLLQATPYTIDEIAGMASFAGGCCVPAHINRDSFSVFSNLGFMPPGLFRCVEIVKSLPCPAIDEGYKVLYSSDAHYLGDISEPNNRFQNISSASDFVAYVNL